MDSRALMMLVVGSALMLSPVALWLSRQQEAAAAEVVAEAPAADLPAGAAPGAAPAETCTGAAIVSTSDRIDCNGETVKVTSRRVTSGGALFVTVGDSPTNPRSCKSSTTSKYSNTSIIWRSNPPLRVK